VATGLGVLPSAIDEEPAVGIFALLRYWAEEPPAHVTLALRYLGERKRKPASARAAREQLGEAANLMGARIAPVSEKTRELVAHVEEMQAKLRAAQKSKPPK